MELEGSFLCLKQSTSCTNPEPDESSPQLTNLAVEGKC